MNEQEFERELLDIKKELKAINSNTNRSLWRTFFEGTLRGLGSVFGVAAAIALIGFLLNTIGVIPAFRERVSSLQQTLENIARNR